MLRLTLVLALLFTQIPMIGELVETLVHRATTGHFAHAEAGEEDLGGTEHGCSAASHHCDCCVSQPVVVPPLRLAMPSRHAAAPLRTPHAGVALEGASLTPFRPPIS